MRSLSLHPHPRALWPRVGRRNGRQGAAKVSLVLSPPKSGFFRRARGGLRSWPFRAAAGCERESWQKRASAVHCLFECPLRAGNAREGGTDRGCREGGKGRRNILRRSVCSVVLHVLQHRAFKWHFPFTSRIRVINRAGCRVPPGINAVSVHPRHLHHWRGFPLHHPARELSQDCHASGSKWRALELSTGGWVEPWFILSAPEAVGLPLYRPVS